MDENTNKLQNIVPEAKEYDPDKLLIQKSLPLILMKEVPFSYGELRILDLYLSLINSHDMTHNRVEIPLVQYCKIMGIKEPHTERLKQNMKNLIKPVQIPAEYIKDIGDTDFDSGWCSFPLFTVADVGCRNNRNFVILECSQRARKVFFNVDTIRYVKYTLGVLLSLSNKNSILFFQYLLKAQFDQKENWIISVDDFKELCFKKDSLTFYTEFKHFKQKVLDPSVKEINGKTDLEINYVLIRNGRNISSIEFNLKYPEDVDEEDTGSFSLDCREKEEKSETKGGNQPTQYVNGKNALPDPEPEKKTSNRKTYDAEFEEFWQVYPRKHDKSYAFKSYKACVNAGYTPEQILTAAKRYAEQCTRNHTEPRYIKMAKTFLGPNHPFEEFLDSVLTEEPSKTQEDLDEEERIREAVRRKLNLTVSGESKQEEN